MLAGNPIARPTLSSTSTTSLPRKVSRGSSAGENRENVSTIVNTRSFVPLDPASEHTKVDCGNRDRCHDGDDDGRDKKRQKSLNICHNTTLL
jgi:hypothetical protein